MLALVTMYLAAHACAPDDGYRAACSEVRLDGSLCEARQVLEPAGGRYGGFIEGEHRWVRDLRWCALSVDSEGSVVGVRYLEPTMSWEAP